MSSSWSVARASRAYENALFFLDTTRMLYGDGQGVAGKRVAEAKQLRL
jgi:NAD(P) transhydrogenase subunit beta